MRNDLFERGMWACVLIVAISTASIFVAAAVRMWRSLL